MQETELKFQVPPAQAEAVRRAVATATAERTRLQALYVDTAERHLARAGIALRLRKEGRRWVQTLKAGGAHAVQRFEHNVLLPAQAGDPPIDLHRHDGTPGEPLLAQALATAPAADGATPLLQVRYRTDIQRLHRMTRAPGGTVELAFDTGHVIAGTERLALAELEIEFVRGHPSALFEAARRWVRRHGLWLDVRSKAERGDRLARGQRASPPMKAGASPLRRGLSPQEARRLALLDALAQVLPNASQIAAGGDVPEHLHQLRVGLRRLRSLLRYTDGWGAALPADVPDRLRALFAALGAARDRDALGESLLPRLVAAGAPAVELPPAAAAAQPPGERLRAPDTTLLWLDLLQAALGAEPPAAVPETVVSGAAPAGSDADGAAPAAPAAAAAAPVGSPQAAAPAVEPAPLKAQAARRLRRWHRRLAQDQTSFATADDAARHALRKRLKRLRYAAEFAAPLFPAKAVARYLAALKPLQESLGDFNDLCVAEALYRERLPDEPRAWFVLGWIAARREVVLQRCGKDLRRLVETRPYWQR